MAGTKLDLVESGLGKVKGSCEEGSETFDCIKCGGFPD